MLKKRILLLGYTGKMGIAIGDIFKENYEIIGKNTKDFNAEYPKSVKRIIEESKPDIVINTVAFLGIDPCEKKPEKAFKINTLYPKLLAELSREKKFLLVHFSTDGVFDDKKQDFYTESDTPCPLHVYGMTKYGGDCFVQSFATRYYIIRIPVLFGETKKNTQFVEKMLERTKKGQSHLRISDDIISSPTYSRDVAAKIKDIIEKKIPYGIYHLTNKGKASLYELMREIAENLKLDIILKPASHKEFPSVGVKNTCTPIASEKIETLRPWKEAVKSYCNNIKNKC